MSSGEEFPLFS